MKPLNSLASIRRIARTRAARSERGQGLVEYALVLGFIAIGSVIVLGTYATAIQGLLNKAVPFP